MTNLDRKGGDAQVGAASAALDAYRAYLDAPSLDPLYDMALLLTDLMHLCDREGGTSFMRVMADARRYYHTETVRRHTAGIEDVHLPEGDVTAYDIPPTSSDYPETP